MQAEGTEELEAEAEEEGAEEAESEPVLVSATPAPWVARETRRTGRRRAGGAHEDCPSYERGEERTSRAAGFLDPDVTETGSGQLVIADFGVDRRSVKTSARTDPTLKSWLRTFESDPTYRLQITGYSDCQGSDAENTHLRQGRATRVEALLGPSARSRVEFRGMMGLGNYLTDNGSPEARARNRAVVIEFRQAFDFPEEEEPTLSATDCAHPSAATSLAEYRSLVMCAERALPSSTPREMLSLLRQLYYSSESWSRCSGKGCQFWSDVIKCGVSVPDPRKALGTPLYTALRDSQVVAGVDMGHVFTGLESMLCPSTDVELDVPGPNWTVKMSNEDFATWGGDLGSAAAHKVYDEQDRGLAPQPWSKYFGTAGSLASDEDLIGDIDAFVIRKGLGGTACGSTKGTKLPALSAPVSQMLFEYYEDASSKLGAEHADGMRCFAEAIGAKLSPSGIINRMDVADSIGRRVFQFADGYYHLKFHPLAGGSAGIGTSLLHYSHEVAGEFVSWLEARL